MKVVTRIEPCPLCGSKDIRFTNCGYSSFDCAQAKCLGCGHEIGVSCSSDARPEWNMYRRQARHRLLYHWMMSRVGDGHLRRQSLESIIEAADAALLRSKKKIVALIRAKGT